MEPSGGSTDTPCRRSALGSWPWARSTARSRPAQRVRPSPPHLSTQCRGRPGRPARQTRLA
eukprot:4023159-Prymnesium_polylepis.1